MLAGWVIDIYALKEVVEGKEQIVGHVWKNVWLWPIGMAVLVTLFFVALFKDDTVVGREEPQSA